MGAIDADARVVECEKTFEYIDPEYHDYKPRVMMQKTDARKSRNKDDSFRAMLKDEDESEALQKKGQMIRTADDAETAIELKKAEVEKEPENSALDVQS